jgi:ATP-dependent DNA ligase
MARRDADGVRLITRKGNDLSRRFPFIVMAVAALPGRSCQIDGEAIVTNEHGLAVFNLIRGHGTLATAVHCAFDLLELDGEDLRRQPIEVRKACWRSCSAAPLRRSSSMNISLAKARSFTSTLASSAAKASCRSGSDHRTSRGDRRNGSRSRIQRHPAVKREAEEDWSR